MKYTLFISKPIKIEVEATSEEDAIDIAYKQLNLTKYDEVKVEVVKEVINDPNKSN